MTSVLLKPDDEERISVASNWSDNWQSTLELDTPSLPPHLRLILHLLERCIKDYPNKRYRQFLDWYFFDENDPDRPFSFLFCCEQLELKPNRILNTIREFKNEH